MSSARRLSPFSYVVLTLVGSGGATAHELTGMMRRGRLHWTAPRSQWYAEPKRLAALGLLEATREPGETTDRTRYALTDAGREALAAWVPSPVDLPQIKNEAVVRVMAARGLGIDGLGGLLDGFTAQLAEARAANEENLAVAQGLGARGAHLVVSQQLVRDVIDALDRWAHAVRALPD